VLKALGIGAGDEVITCPNSFIASAWVIVAAGAKPVFVDAGEDYNIDAAKLESAITSRTRAIIPVHLTGRPADMDAINAIAAKRGLAVLEDAAQAIGARLGAKRVGALGTAAGFSLHPLKNLGVYGDGGLITTDDTPLFERLAKHQRDGLPVKHHFGREQGLVVPRRPRVAFAWCVPAGQCREDAGLVESGRGVKTGDACVRMRRHHRPRMQQVGKPVEQIVRVDRAAGHVTARAFVRQRLTGDRHAVIP